MELRIDGRIFPVGTEPAGFKEGELQITERWYPIQVKQNNKVGRPEIDSFEAMMMSIVTDAGSSLPVYYGMVWILRVR